MRQLQHAHIKKHKNTPHFQLFLSFRQQTKRREREGCVGMGAETDRQTDRDRKTETDRDRQTEPDLRKEREINRQKKRTRE